MNVSVRILMTKVSTEHEVDCTLRQISLQLNHFEQVFLERHTTLGFQSLQRLLHLSFGAGFTMVTLLLPYTGCHNLL